MVDDRTVGYPDPQRAEDAAQFVALLKELRAWSGQVSLRRLRSLGGSTSSVSGAVVDALPPTTVSDILAGKRLPALPRRAFVEAFVTACLSAHGCSAAEIEPMLASWVSAWQELTLRQTATRGAEPEARDAEAQDAEAGHAALPPDTASEPDATGAAGGIDERGTAHARTGRWRRVRRPVGVLLVVLVVAAVAGALLAHHDRPGHRRATTSLLKRTGGLPAGFYRVEVVGTGRCLSERPGNNANGLVFETDCAKNFPSRGLEPQADGTYRITTFHPVYGPGCMGVRSASTTVGAAVNDDFCNRGNAVAFRLLPVTQPVVGFRIVSATNNLCLGVQLDPKLAVGDPDDPVPAGPNWAPVRQLRCDPSATTQVFRFDRMPAATTH